MRKILIILIVLMISLLNGYAQQYSNTRSLEFECSDSVILDSLSVIPGTLSLFDSSGQEIDESTYSVNYSSSVLYFNKGELPGGKCTALFRVFNYNLSGVYQPIVPVYDTVSGVVVSKPLTGFEQVYEEPEDEDRIVATGNISRGVTTGNGQNVVMNSNMNLQLTGHVDDNVKIEAYLSDKNVPVQPDGYSQQINQFDQIYIRLYDTARYLQMGDVDIQGSNSYFLKFNRRLLGGDFAGTFYSDNGTEVYSQASAAIAKGTFNRLETNGIEGVQGPYRLTGADNEQYVVVLAGSEKVFVDGELLSRGENADYIIDYNTAEVTFMPSVLISKDSRIIVEYEYSDRKYNKFLLYGQTGVKHKKTEFNIQYFSEGDSKNQPVEEDLSDSHKLILSESGDNVLNAIVPDFDSVGFDNNRVMYALVDTIVGADYYDSVLVVSNDPDKAIYNADFAFVGVGSGNYIRTASNANGRVFKWVAPVNGEMQGDYESVRLLAAPKRLQLFVFSGKQHIGNSSAVYSEFALSNNDQNTFSEKDSHDDNGVALTTGVEHVFDVASQKMKVYGKYDFIHKDFATPERFRSAEFERDWNFDLDSKGDQHFVECGAVLFKKKKESVNVNFQRLEQLSVFEGFRINSDLNIGNDKNLFHSSNSYLKSDDIYKNTFFYRHTTGYTRYFKKFKTGVSHEIEYNEMKGLGEDTLLMSSDGKSVSGIFLANAEESKIDYKLEYNNVIGLYPRAVVLEHLTTANEYSGSVGVGNSAKHRLNLLAAYRELAVYDSALATSIKNRNNFVGRVEHNLKLWKRAVAFSTFYEVGSGMEARKEYYYIEVPLGQGVYVWVDYNENNIAELNEFERSKFTNEANYIRVYTPTSDYIQTFMLKFNETVKIDFYRVWRSEEGLKGLLSRFSNTASYRVNQKQTSDDIGRRLNPFGSNLFDTTLISQNTGWRNNFSFNRRGTVWGVDYIYINANNKALLSNGFEQSIREKHEVRLRWNIIESLMLQPAFYLADKSYESEFFSNRNYYIKESSGESALQWQPDPKFRLRVSYSYVEKNNYSGGEFSIVQTAGPEVKYNTPGKGSVSGQFLAVNTLYNGAENSSVRYEMLDGYVPGVNYRWNVNVSRNLNKFLRLSVLYNGRAGDELETIHTGQMSLVAFF